MPILWSLSRICGSYHLKLCVGYGRGWAVIRRSRKCLYCKQWFDLFEYLMNTLDDEDLELSHHIARQIWMRRNYFLFKGNFLSPVTLLQQGLDSMEAYRTACSTLSSHVEVKYFGWSVVAKACCQLVKANWDAALDTKNHRMGVGMLVRNDEGSVWQQ
ncbi:hypothetical protein SLA2020_262110 [Shorea laevis]